MLFGEIIEKLEFFLFKILDIINICVISYLDKETKGIKIMNVNALQNYAEQDKICQEQIKIIEPFLKKFSEEHDAGTRFYNDITVLCGPMPFFGTDWFYATQEGRDINERFHKNQASIYVIKWAGASIVIEYYFTNFYQGKMYPAGTYAPQNAFMVWKNQKYPVPMDVALAVQKLYQAQEYRSAIYSAHREEMDKILNKSNQEGR